MSVGPNKRVGTILKNRREELGLSQRAVAEVMGYKQHQFVSQIEQGKAPLPAAYIVKVAKRLSLDPVVVVDAFVLDIKEMLLHDLKLTPRRAPKPKAQQQTTTKMQGRVMTPMQHHHTSNDDEGSRGMSTTLQRLMKLKVVA